MIERFKPIPFHRKTLEMIHLANSIIRELEALGYTLTLRQLYYQLVARDVIKNKQSEYKRLGSILSDARLAGLVDWDAIEDRTRGVRGVNHFASPADVLQAAHDSYRIDKWQNQDHRIEVWVEKDALVGIMEKACRPLDVKWFSCRGYTSQTALYWAAKRLISYHEDGKRPIVLHFGDHDPSGTDMTRDIEDRIAMFTQPYGMDLGDFEINRLALNMDQIRKYNPPPNPAKQTDSRYEGYRREHGVECWELDALDPQVIDKLITETVKSYRDEAAWEDMVAKENTERGLLSENSSRWSELSTILAMRPGDYRIAKPLKKRAKKTPKTKPKTKRKK